MLNNQMVYRGALYVFHPPAMILKNFLIVGMGWKHKEDRLAKPDGGYVCRTYSWLGVTSFFPCCFWIFKSSKWRHFTSDYSDSHCRPKKGGTLRLLPHHLQSREAGHAVRQSGWWLWTQVPEGAWRWYLGQWWWGRFLPDTMINQIYTLVNVYITMKSPCLMGTSTNNCHFR